MALHDPESFEPKPLADSATRVLACPAFYSGSQAKSVACKIHLWPAGCEADRSSGLVDMHPLKTTSAALAGVAVLAMIVVQFVPWATFDFSTGGFSGFGINVPPSEGSIDANTWNNDVSSGSRSDTTSWYDGDMDDADGVGMIRAAVPILLVGAVVTLVGALLVAARGNSLGAIVALVGGILLAIGTTLFGVGTGQFYGDADYHWAASFYLAIVACTLALAGGVLGLMAGNTANAKTAF
jgi:hypothetical protein